MGLFSKIKEGLKKTRDSVVGQIDSMLKSFTKIDDDQFEELEELLVMGDVGINTAQRICEELKARVKRDGVKDPNQSPGLGGTAQSAARAAETQALVQQLLPGFAGSAVLDADGLNAAARLLAEGGAFPHPAEELIVTPHPGEMARLTGLSAAQINADREGTALRYAQAWNAVVVLKGARTVVAAPDGRVRVNPTGNPGLSRGGSGDVLAGMTAALLACRLPAYEAAACAVYLHGAAADRAAAVHGEYGMLPHDILPELGRMFAEHQR